MVETSHFSCDINQFVTENTLFSLFERALLSTSRQIVKTALSCMHGGQVVAVAECEYALPRLISNNATE
jgi:hypothetical protein